ncbi:MAG: diguanylate cyclase (GGDEF)-like protein/PAS domain S-box-containing protein [Alteromonadaceae bacterium]|jgi:diguanylate cyclase (GGDEF)-like protein/PAS domain S-box-containing protein
MLSNKVVLVHNFSSQLMMSNFATISRIISAALVTLYLLTVSSLSLAATMTSPIKFEQLTTKDGLSQSYVYDMVQDQQGFIWIATQDGLNRYDGDKFVHYRHNILEPNSLANNFIRKVFIDKDNTLWVGTDNGLSKFNRQTNDFRNFTTNENNHASLKDNVIWNIYQDKKNKLWITTEQGIHKYNAKTNEFERIRILKYEKKLKEIRTVYQDSKNNFWFGTYENGIYLAETNGVDNTLSETFHLKTEKNKWNLSIPATTLYDIELIDNQYWLATDFGVYVLDENYQLVKHYNSLEDDGKLLSNEVRSIVQVNVSTIWIGTSKGISAINLHDNSSLHYQKPLSLTDNKIYTLIKDNADKIWVGTSDGINTFNPISTLFEHYLFNEQKEKQNIEAIVELSDNTVLFARENAGIYSMSVSGNTTKLDIKLDDNISHIVSNTSNEVFFRTYSNRLYQYNIANKNLIEHKNWYNNAQHPIENRLFLVDTSIWFINSDSLLTNYNVDIHNFNLSVFPEKYKFTSLTKSKTKHLWLTTSTNELISYTPDYKELKVIPVSHDEKYLLSKTSNISVSDKWAWLSSFEQGLMLINKKSNRSWVFNNKNGLKNNLINDIFIDDNDNAWFSTNKGISSIDPQNRIVKNFGENFGVTRNEFMSGSGLSSSNGIIYFGGLNGFHSFEPSEVLAVLQQPSLPVFTDLLIANNRVRIKSEVSAFENVNDFTLSKQLNELEQLILKHEQSPFSIEFVSPNIKLANQIKYRYRLTGLEENWIETGIDNRRATYTNLDAGDYSFEVQAIDLLDSAKSDITSIKITIMPPWWLSRTAIFIYSFMSLLVAAYILQQIRHKRLYHLQIKLSEERLKLSLWGSGDEMWDWNIKQGKIFRSNIWGVLEFPQDGRRNVGAEETNINTKDLERVKEALNDHFDKKTDHFEATYRVRDKDDKWIWVLDRGKIVERDEKGVATRMTGTLKDISKIKRADARLRLFAKCIENISDAVVIYDRTFKIVDVNKSYQRITRKSKASVMGNALSFSQYPESFRQAVKQHLLSKGSWHGEIESKHDNGEQYYTALNIDVIKDENQSISHFVGVFSDVTERKANEVELRKLANSDTLTGLPNRSYFQANQHKLVKSKIPHALLVFDLDNFKKINDSMGHGVGDVLLCMVAKRMVKISRKQDTVYRLGGDEFSIIVENTNDIHTITTIAKDILRSIAQPLKLKSQEVVLYSSIGIVLYPEDGASPQELLKNADTAMYHAKDSGGNKYQFFSDSMNKKAVKRLQIENLIRHGLKEDFFSVFYQPKIEIATGKVAGMEALVRFQTPSKGIISPIVFIPVSEETGQIIDIGEVVLRKSCFATKKWVDAGLFTGRIAVNLSAVQFTQTNLVGMIADILKESQLPAKYLELEITEGTVMDSPQKAIETMLQIRAMGIHLSLDDFGTGYSSLAYLKKFPLNTLKIDKAFVDDIETSEQGRNMVATIVTIAHNLDLNVVAEGVETNNQLNFLAGLKCEQLQGYLYSKPLPESDFQKYLLSHQITDKSTSFN